MAPSAGRTNWLYRAHLDGTQLHWRTRWGARRTTDVTRLAEIRMVDVAYLGAGSYGSSESVVLMAMLVDADGRVVLRDSAG